MLRTYSTKYNSEAGVTLLISILLMSTIALISLAVAAFTIQEIRASRADVITEPAIAAAESAGEQGLWAIKRGTTTLTNCAFGSTNSNLSNGAVVNSCESFSAATFAIKANAPFVFYLYDPNNINGDVDLLAYPYTNLTITEISGTFSTSINVVRLDGTPVGAQPVTVVPGATQVISIQPVSAGSEGRMKVTLLSIADATLNVNTNQGMPNFPTINAAGCSSNSAIQSCNSSNTDLYSRRINIVVPQ